MNRFRLRYLEFDSWYTDSYLDGEANIDDKDVGTMVNNIVYEDHFEKFDAVKHSKFEGRPDLEAYNRAQESLIHRVYYVICLIYFLSYFKENCWGDFKSGTTSS